MLDVYDVAHSLLLEGVILGRGEFFIAVNINKYHYLQRGSQLE